MSQQSDIVIAIIVIFFVSSWLAVGLRLYTRLGVNKSFGTDDGFIAAMQLFYTAYLASQIQGWKHGIGRHHYELSDEDRKQALMWWFICSQLYIICVGLFKISLGFFLLRITIVPVHIWTLRFLTWGTVFSIVVYFFVALFQCTPPTVFWEEGPRTLGKCYSDPVLVWIDISASIINCAADWTFGIIPWFVVRSLNMPSQTKFLVLLILVFGAVGSIATFARIFFLHRLTDGDDFLFSSSQAAYLSTVECGVGATAVCIGTLRPLWEHWRGKPTSLNPSSSSHNHSWSPWPSQRSEQRRSYIRTQDSELNIEMGSQNQVATNVSKDLGTLTLVTIPDSVKDIRSTRRSGFDRIIK